MISSTANGNFLAGASVASGGCVLSTIPANLGALTTALAGKTCTGTVDLSANKQWTDWINSACAPCNLGVPAGVNFTVVTKAASLSIAGIYYFPQSSVSVRRVRYTPYNTLAIAKAVTQANTWDTPLSVGTSCGTAGLSSPPPPPVLSPPPAKPPPPMPAVAEKPPPPVPAVAAKPPPPTPATAAKPPPPVPAVAEKPPPPSPVGSIKPPPPAPVTAASPPPAFTPVYVKSKLTLTGISTLTTAAAQIGIGNLIHEPASSVAILSITTSAARRRNLLTATTAVAFQVLVTNAAQQVSIASAIPAATLAQIQTEFPGTTAFAFDPATVASTASWSSPTVSLNNNKGMTVATIVIIALLFGLFLISALVQYITNRRAPSSSALYTQLDGGAKTGAMSMRPKRRFLVGSSFLRGSQN
jgi:hypothetical protein